MKIDTKRCGPRKGTITALERKLLPGRTFALPGRRYPLYVVDRGEAVPDREHAVNAKARATQQYERGRLSAKDLARVRRQADQVLAMCDRIEGKQEFLGTRRIKPKASSCGCSHADEKRVLQALPASPAAPVLQPWLAHKVGMPEYQLERVLRGLHKRGEVSREQMPTGPAWRAGKAPSGTRGKFTVKLYCDDGSVKREGRSTLGAARKRAAELRAKYAGPCAVAIIDAQGVILQQWEG